jgi:hypothetical protein
MVIKNEVNSAVIMAPIQSIFQQLVILSVTFINKVFSGHRRCQFVRNHQRVWGYLCPCHHCPDTADPPRRLY